MQSAAILTPVCQTQSLLAHSSLLLVYTVPKLDADNGTVYAVQHFIII